MSFRDLPPDWTHVRLEDPVLARDVLDLFIGDKDREVGGVGVLICHPDTTLAQPVFIHGPVPVADRRVVMRKLVDICRHVMPYGGLVLGIARSDGPPCDADRELHQLTIEVCRETGFRLVGVHVVTRAGIVSLPSPQRAA